MIGNLLNTFRMSRYERMKDLREWLITKLSLLTLEGENLDPDSPEAKKLQAIIVRYMERVAAYDKKLGDRKE